MTEQGTQGEAKIEELSEALWQEEQRPTTLPCLREVLGELVARVQERRAQGVLLFDGSRLRSWEQQHGAQALDVILGLLGDALESMRTPELLGEDALVVFEHPASDRLLVFPGSSSLSTLPIVDLEELVYRVQSELGQSFRSQQLFHQEALEQIAAGSGLILHERTVDPQRSIYRAMRYALQDAQAAHLEAQRRRNRIVGRVIAHQRIQTWFQPIVTLPDRAVFGFEALSRPQETDARKLGVHLFVAASRADLDNALDRTCRDLSIQRRPALQEARKLFINCLPNTFYDDMDELEGLLTHWHKEGLAPHQLVFEITENITRKQAQRILRNVRSLRSRGYRFALDDVGTGMANMELLAELQPDFIKMDMSLTIGLSTSPGKRELAMYLLDLAKRYDAHLIAEGIETEQDLEVLLDLGVPLGQGFLLGRPTPHHTRASA